MPESSSTVANATVTYPASTHALLKEAKALQDRLLKQAEDDVLNAKTEVARAVKAVTDARDALRTANATLRSVKAAGPRQARKPKTETKPATVK